MTDTATPQLTCQPDHPFGCTHTWGPPIAGFGEDGRQHICNRDSSHRGRHRCHCGTTAAVLLQVEGAS